MFQGIINQGQVWVRRLNKYVGVKFSDIPVEERISRAEVEGWRNGARAAVAKAFGEDSAQRHKWDKVVEDHYKDRGSATFRERYVDGFDELSHLVDKLVGLLAEYETLLRLGTASVQPREEGDPSGAPTLPSVFISYSHYDKPRASEIASVLHALGIRYFLDSKDVDWGDAIGTAIESGLRECSHQIIILSPGSAKSMWVHFEVGFAIGSGKKALPFLEHPAMDLPGYIAGLKPITETQDLRKYFEDQLRRLRDR